MFQAQASLSHTALRHMRNHQPNTVLANEKDKEMSAIERTRLSCLMVIRHNQAAAADGAATNRPQASFSSHDSSRTPNPACEVTSRVSKMDSHRGGSICSGPGRTKLRMKMTTQVQKIAIDASSKTDVRHPVRRPLLAIVPLCPDGDRRWTYSNWSALAWTTLGRTSSSTVRLAGLVDRQEDVIVVRTGDNCGGAACPKRSRRSTGRSRPTSRNKGARPRAERGRGRQGEVEQVDEDEGEALLW